MPYVVGERTRCHGRIFQKAQVAEANGTKVANLILAVDKGKDARGNRIIDFYDCAFWFASDVKLIVRYPEGHLIEIIDGTKECHSYKDKFGNFRERVKVTVYVWTSLEPLPNEDENAASNASANVQSKVQQKPSADNKVSTQAELTNKALSFKFSKGQYSGKTVEDVLKTDCTYIYNLCKNDRVNPEMRQMLKIAYNYWYYNYYQQEKAKQPPQKADRMIEGVARNNVKRIPANTPSSKLPY